MSSKRQERQARRARRAEPRGSLLRRSREAGGIRVGLPVVILIALAFVLWIIFDLGGLRP